jgi:hypothetical protein
MIQSEDQISFLYSGPPECILTWWGQIFFKVDSLAPLLEPPFFPMQFNMLQKGLI